MNAVETKGLTKKYPTTLAVDNINIAVPQGACCGFLGKNGAGKTTTIKMLVGLIRPTAGQMHMMGQEQFFGQQNSAIFGYLPDVPNFYSYMTAGEFLTLCAKICKIPTGEAKSRIASLLKQVGLNNTRAKIGGFSRGMKQRLGIAQAMINQPKVIFMDEPMSALDPMGRKDVAEIIQSLKDTTVIFSTHILGDIESTCNHILIIEKGKIVAQDNMAALRARHAENSAKVAFYQVGDAQLFADKFGTGITKTSPLTFTLQGEPGKMEALSRKVTDIAHSNSLAIESFAAHSPSLEEIFYKEIGVEINA